jgi:hypothetical protein
VTTSDHNLLAEVSAQLSAHPFASAVEVFGQRMSRPMARSMERMLLRQRVAERKCA